MTRTLTFSALVLVALVTGCTATVAYPPVAQPSVPVAHADAGPSFTGKSVIGTKVIGIPGTSAASGGGGTVTTSSPVSGTGSVGSPVTIAAGAVPLTALATQASGTVVCNNSGSTASPTACTFTPPVDFITTLASAGTDITVSGLAGDTDGDYEIDVFLNMVNPSSIRLRPNALTANQASTRQYVNSAGTTGAALYTELHLHDTTTTGRYEGHVYFTSKSGRQRYFHSTGYSAADLGMAEKTDGEWNDTATAITSLDLNCATAAGFGIGSFMRVRALHKAN